MIKSDESVDIMSLVRFHEVQGLGEPVLISKLVFAPPGTTSLGDCKMLGMATAREPGESAEAHKLRAVRRLLQELHDTAGSNG